MYILLAAASSYLVVSQAATESIFYDSGRELAMGDGKEENRVLDDGDAKEDSDLEVEPERLQYKVATICFAKCVQGTSTIIL